MRTILTLAAAVLLSGCTQLTVHEGKSLAKSQLTPSGHASFKGLVANGRHVCGQINVTDAIGVESGFRGFIVDLDARQVIAEPSLESDPAVTPFQHAFKQLDQDMSLMDFSAESFQHCGHSVASAAADDAKQTLTRHFGMAVVPRLDDESL
jgi:hypothetical protein